MGKTRADLILSSIFVGMVLLLRRQELFYFHGMVIRAWEIVTLFDIRVYCGRKMHLRLGYNHPKNIDGQTVDRGQLGA